MRDTLILGATGRVGRRLVSHLVERGVGVRAVVRDPAAARAVLGTEVQLIAGDLRASESLIDAAAGCDRIAFLAGTNGFGERGTSREIEYAAVATLATALDPQAIERFVLLSSAGVTQPEHPHNCSYDSVLKWKLRGEDALRQSGVGYTVIRALGLRDRPGGAHGVRMVQGDRIAFGEEIARADLAAFLADVLAPRAEDGFAAGFDADSLLSATCEVFNDQAIIGDRWDSARPALHPDPVVAA